MPIRKNAHFSFGGTDMSGDVLSLDVSESVATNDGTVMGSNTRRVEGGLLDWSFSGTIQGNANGLDTSEVAFHAILATAAKTGAVVYRNDAGAKSTTNAEWTGTGVLTDFSFSGATGDKIIWSFTIMPGSALTRATS